MSTPIKKSLLKIRRGRPTWIVIHHSVCQSFDPQNKIDTKKAQIGRERIYAITVAKEVDINFHFMVERIDKDYEVLIAKPIVAACNFDDILGEYYRSIHVAVLGNYSIQNAETRLYNVLCYRLIVPLMKVFAIPIDRVVFHSDISTNKDCTCPGASLFLPILRAKIKEFWMK